jgi:hypothetical protein
MEIVKAVFEFLKGAVYFILVLSFLIIVSPLFMIKALVSFIYSGMRYYLYGI